MQHQGSKQAEGKHKPAAMGEETSKDVEDQHGEEEHGAIESGQAEQEGSDSILQQLLFQVRDSVVLDIYSVVLETDQLRDWELGMPPIISMMSSQS